MYHFYFPIKAFLKKNRLSERALSETLQIARGTIRSILLKKDSLSLNSIKSVANYFGHEASLVTYPKNHRPESSSLAISMKIQKDGVDSWKIHLMDMVDEFRKSLDMRLFLLPPSQECPERIQAMIASTVLFLCQEADVTAPDWAHEVHYLSQPWFVAEVESLKAFALLESPLSFRRNNIFVQNNFLERA